MMGTMRTMQQHTGSTAAAGARTEWTARARVAALALGLGVVLAACADDGATDPAGGADDMGAPAAADGGVVTTADDATFGTILTDGSGMTLYLFTSDSPGVSTCVDGGLAAWPPLLTDGEPVAQGGADGALLGTLTRDDGTVQVTYGGWPLYRYAADMAPGDVTGQSVNGVWFLVAPEGTAVTDGGSADSTDTTPPSDSGMGGTGGSGGPGGPATADPYAY